MQDAVPIGIFKDMKKNAVGWTGIAIAMVVALLIVTMKTPSFFRGIVQLDGALIVVVLGFIAAVRGSLFWLILTAVGIAEIAYVMF